MDKYLEQTIWIGHQNRNLAGMSSTETQTRACNTAMSAARKWFYLNIPVDLVVVSAA